MTNIVTCSQVEGLQRVLVGRNADVLAFEVSWLLDPGVSIDEDAEVGPEQPGNRRITMSLLPRLPGASTGNTVFHSTAGCSAC
jgi:hypothetical protein